ncbi:hypothetical protein JK628_18055 [Shewanella sp. KX20019]|uniref:hypothetical protein n=1 Tax=Shewanella sp. KX20019 TaxID=2803864 RepID=UPI001925D631|nr:hypothetical protein [Shewanella sp. KX20019]QQX79412.1 hypothetical protein JK628_18055 [Shewanella sp. KX20019]
MTMFQVSALMLTLVGVGIIYATSKHQRLLQDTLPKPLAWVGSSLLLFALLSWMQLLTTTAAIFTWLFTIVALLICVPFTTLTKTRENHR